jgi:hypothetical protein
MHCIAISGICCDMGFNGSRSPENSSLCWRLFLTPCISLATGERKFQKLKWTKFFFLISNENELINLAMLLENAWKINFDKISNKFEEVSKPKASMFYSWPTCRLKFSLFLRKKNMIMILKYLLLVLLVAQIYNLSTWDTEAGRLWVWPSLGLRVQTFTFFHLFLVMPYLFIYNDYICEI